MDFPGEDQGVGRAACLSESSRAFRSFWLLEEPPFLGPRPLPLSHSQQGGPLLPPPLWFSPLPLGLLLTRQGKVLLLRADWAHLEIQGNLSTSRPKFLIPKATSLCQVR